MSGRLATGILGGSFNPVHIGHLLLADYLVQFANLDQVWLMLSPLNPLKADSASELADDSHRLEMLRLACGGIDHVQPTGIELSMPRPNYSIDSLSALAAMHPQREFRLIIGSDNWMIFNRWRRHEEIMERFSPIVYPRPGYPVDARSLPQGVTMVEAPVFDISSTFLRRSIAGGHNMNLFLPAGVWDYIKTNKLYGYGNHPSAPGT